MRFGLLDFGRYQRTDRTLTSVIAYAIEAERLGFDSVWLGEHHLSNELWASPVRTMATLLENTTTIKIGSGGILLNHVDPVTLAEELIRISVRFPGRLEVGMAKGQPLGSGDFAVPTDTTACFRHRIELVARIFRESRRSTPPIYYLGASERSFFEAKESDYGYVHSLFLSRSTPLRGEMSGCDVALMLETPWSPALGASQRRILVPSNISTKAQIDEATTNVAVARVFFLNACEELGRRIETINWLAQDLDIKKK